MNKRHLTIRALGVLAGIAIGVPLYSYVHNKARTEGRFSACKELITVINTIMPLLDGDCKIEGGEVYIFSKQNPKVRYTLDGEEVK